jgi:hypothetical protein
MGINKGATSARKVSDRRVPLPSKLRVRIRKRILVVKRNVLPRLSYESNFIGLAINMAIAVGTFCNSVTCWQKRRCNGKTSCGTHWRSELIAHPDARFNVLKRLNRYFRRVPPVPVTSIRVWLGRHCVNTRMNCVSKFNSCSAAVHLIRSEFNAVKRDRVSCRPNTSVVNRCRLIFIDRNVKRYLSVEFNFEWRRSTLKAYGNGNYVVMTWKSC